VFFVVKKLNPALNLRNRVSGINDQFSFPTPHLLNLLSKKSLHILFLGQFELIFGDKELVVHAGKGIFYQGVIFSGTQEDPHRWIVAFGHLVLFKPAYVGIKLTDMFVTEFIDFQFDQYMAFKDAVVKDQIDKVMTISDQDALLPGLETKTVSHLQQKLLQLIQ